MFCSSCGTENTDDAISCTSCSASFTKKSPAGFQADKAKEQVKEAMNDAWATFRALGLDPVGELLNAITV